MSSMGTPLSVRRPHVSRSLVAALVSLCFAALAAGTPAEAGTTGVPSAPLDVVAKVGPGRTVTVTWKAPTDGGTSPLKKYRVEVSPDVATATVLASAARSKKFDLSSVPASTQLSVTVTANNAVGDGPASAPTPTFTVPATVPDAASAITVSDAPGNPLISWTLGHDGGSPITKSTLTIQPGDRVITVQDDTRKAEVAGLAPGRKYTVAVVVSNAIGNSDPVTSSSFTPWRAPDKVTRLKAVRGYQEAKLTWKRSVTHGRAVTAYRVKVVPGGSFTVPGTNASAKLTGLHNGTRYTATVTPLVGSRSFAGTTSPTFVPAGNPGPPYVLGVHAAKGKVSVRWNAAFTNGEKIRRYVLAASNGFKIGTLSPGTRRYTVTGLKRGTKIKFRMRSVNAVGPSPWGGWTQTVTVR